MADSNKRKQAPGQDRDRRGPKRSKGGSGGKWQTPHQKAKLAASQGSGKIEPGDVGIWATCAKNQENRAREELLSMFEDCAERFYGIVARSVENDEEDSVDDIESSIQKELESLGNKKGKPQLFSPVPIDLPCVIFFKTQSPIDPVDFVHKICVEIVSKPGIRRMRYVNRLTPMEFTGKATEKGLEEVGRTVLGKHFRLAGETSKGDEEGTTPSTYAIRPTIRNHHTLTRDVAIKQTAALVDEAHKVDLTKPDKVIIIEVFQTVCGMSVLGSDWEKLKRFNLAELYPSAPKAGATSQFKAEAIPESVTRDEARLEGHQPTSTDEPDSTT